MIAARIEPVANYDKTNYRKGQAIGDDTISYLVLEQVIDLILEGYSFESIHEVVTPAYGWNSYEFKFIYNKAMKVMRDRANKQSENLKEKQLQRLLKLWRRCEKNNDRRAELAVLAEINKLNNLYIEKIELTNNEVVFRIDGEDNTEPES